MASLSAVRSTTIAFTTSRDPTKGGSLCRQRCMDCAGAVAGPCCAKNGSNAGKTDRSLIALGNPACPNKFARRRDGGGASFLVVCGDLKPPAHLVHENERKRRRYDRATLAAGASWGACDFLARCCTGIGLHNVVAWVLRQWVALQPQCASTRARIDTGLFPPSRFITTMMN